MSRVPEHKSAFDKKRVAQQPVELSGRYILALFVMLCMAVLLVAKAFYLHVYDRAHLLEQGDNRYTRVLMLNANRGNIVDRYGKTLAASAPVVSVWADPKELYALMVSNKKVQDEMLVDFRDSKYKKYALKERKRIERLPTKLSQFKELTSSADNEAVKRDIEIRIAKNRDLQAAVEVDFKNSDIKKYAYHERQRIEALPTKLSDFEQLSQLARLLNIEQDKIEQRIERYKNSRFVFLVRHLAPEMEEAINALKFPAVYIQDEYRRYYPAGEVTAPFIGFANIDNVGREGIEYAYEKFLASKNGRRRIVKDLSGAVVEDLEMIESAQPGSDIQLSLDLRLQYMAYRSLGEALKTHEASKGMATVLDVETGEVLAMVSLPAFNPNERTRGNAALRRNRAAIDVFEPGSTIKPFIMAVALEHELVGQTESIKTSPGYVRVGKKTIKDHRDYGELTPEYIIAKSSNVGMAKVIERIDDEVLFDMLNRLGFGTHLSTGFRSEPSGELPRPPYSKMQKAIMSYGYGVSVTSLQLAQAYSVIASKGMLRPISLTKVGEIPKAERVMSEQTANAVLDMMQTVVTDGTAKKARISGYAVAGKTGTAHKLVKGQYADDQYVSSFVGVAPAKNPKYVMAVVIDNPKGNYYFGGSVAAPVFASVMESLLPLTGVRPQQAAGYIAQEEKIRIQRGEPDGV